MPTLIKVGNSGGLGGSLRSLGARLFSSTQSIIRSYTGSLYLPSPTSCFTDVAGTTPCGVDTTVALKLDEMRTLGSELVTNGDFTTDTSWTKGAGWTIGGGTANVSGASGGVRISQPIGVVGKTYRITYDVTAISAGGFTAVAGGTAGTYHNAVGQYTDLLQCITAGNLGVAVSGTTTGSIDNISVREVTGIHATQATAGFRPTLRFVDGKWYEEFDGISKRQTLSSVPFQMSDDHFVVASGVSLSNATARIIFSSGSTASATPSIRLGYTTLGYAQATWTDDAGTTATITGTTNLLGTPHVIAMTKQGNDKKLLVNNVQIGATDTTVMGATTLNQALIGARVGTTTAEFASGNINIGEIGNGAITTAQLTTISRLAGQKVGVTI